MLRIERECLNDKNMEIKGLEALILEYQDTFAAYETQQADKDK